MDDSTGSGVLGVLSGELAAVWARMNGLLAVGVDLERVEGAVRQEMLALGARLLEAGIAARGTGKTGPWQACRCGGDARFSRYRTKQVQTTLGGIAVRRASYRCAACGVGWCPLDRTLGFQRDSLSAGVRRMTCRLGALLPFAEAAATLEVTAGVRLSASTVRGVTEAVGTRREQQLTAARAAAWEQGVARTDGPAPARLSVAMDGVRIMGTDGGRREVKVGVGQPVAGEVRASKTFAAGLEPAAAFGQRLALEAHRRGLEDAGAVAVLGDGPEWIWNLAAEHFPTATMIVDWFHASERVWDLGRALLGAGTPATKAWVGRQLDRLPRGHAAALAAEWQMLDVSGAAALVRDEQVTYFTNQASRMAYDRDRADGWDIGSGIVEAACKHLIGAREKGPGMRWSDRGAQAVAAVRVLIFNDQWTTHDLAA